MRVCDLLANAIWSKSHACSEFGAAATIEAKVGSTKAKSAF